MHRIGFSCKTSDDGYQVGPFSACDLVSEQDVEQMYKYMLRAWVEITLYLQAFQRANAKPLYDHFITGTRLSEVLNPVLDLNNIPRSKTWCGNGADISSNALGPGLLPGSRDAGRLSRGHNRDHRQGIRLPNV
jgi:hypothetical protein